jgi:hypothetical protein
MAMKNNIKDEKRGNFYWVDEKPFVSVTQVLKAIDKPALRYWFGKEVYYAMVKDPTLGEKEALSAPYKSSDKARMRGSTVHSIVEAYKQSGAVIDNVPEELKGYAKAFYKWIADNEVNVDENEKTVVSKSYGYAGTLDMLMSKGGDKWIIDVKTGKDIYPESFLQLSAYKHALEEDAGLKIERMGVLLLQENGKYKFAEAEDFFGVFLATKKVWEFLNKDICDSVGYDKTKTS